MYMDCAFMASLSSLVSDLPDRFDNSTRRQIYEDLLQPEYNTEALKNGDDLWFRFSNLGEFVDVYADRRLPNKKCNKSKTG